MGHGRDFSNMNRRAARMLLLPLVLLFLMTPKVRSQARSGKSPKIAGSKSAGKQSASQQTSPKSKSSTEDTGKWMESTLREMSVEEKVGQLLFTTYHGSFTSTDAATYAQLMHDVEDLHVGGFINVTQGSPLGFLKSQAYPSAVLSNQLQAKSKLPLLIGADFERGTAMRRDEGTSFPTAMARAAAGHLNVPALEPDPNTPATLSSRVLTDLLRRQLGFQGLVVTDAMDMGGITVRYAPSDAAVRAFLAGADALLMPPVPDAAYEALLAAAHSGQISKERLDASVRQILEGKARLGLQKKRLAEASALNEKFGRVAWQAESQEISDRGITLLRDTPQRLPLDGTKPARALLGCLYADPEPYPGGGL